MLKSLKHSKKIKKILYSTDNNESFGGYGTILFICKNKCVKELSDVF